MLIFAVVPGIYIGLRRRKHRYGGRPQPRHELLMLLLSFSAISVLAYHNFTSIVKHLKGVLQRTFFISTNERLMYKFYKNCNYFIFK